MLNTIIFIFLIISLVKNIF